MLGVTHLYNVVIKVGPHITSSIGNNQVGLLIRKVNETPKYEVPKS